MAKRDIIHGAVKNALIKSGWTITADPYKIEYAGLRVEADLAAERPLAAERNGEKIVVEVKSFLGPSLVRDLELALGQYKLYHRLLKVTAPEYKLYLAISDTVHSDFFTQEAVEFIVREESLALIVVNTQQEEVTQWINSLNIAT